MYYWTILFLFMGGAVASWLVRSFPDRVVRVRALAGDIVLCSWARHFTNILAMLLSAQVYKWVALNFNAGGNPVMDWHPIYAMETGICSGSMDHLA